MFNSFFAWDEAYTQKELAIFPEILAQFIALLRTTRKYHANRTGDHHRKLIAQLEQGVAPWRKPWSTSIPRNLISKKSYRGLNVFLLATQAYGSPYWVTFNQANQLGAHVRQGEKNTLVSFWKFNEYARENGETGELENKTSVLLRYYRVVNVEQCDG
jgi:antirestriction protein ArdC